MVFGQLFLDLLSLLLMLHVWLC